MDRGNRDVHRIEVRLVGYRAFPDQSRGELQGLGSWGKDWQIRLSLVSGGGPAAFRTARLSPAHAVEELVDRQRPDGPMPLASVVAGSSLGLHREPQGSAYTKPFDERLPPVGSNLSIG